MRIWIFLIFAFIQSNIIGQDSIQKITGVITFKSSVNYYVKFDNTSLIKVGDTLYFANQLMEAALVINNKSSTSCIGTRVSIVQMSVGDNLIAKIKNTTIPVPSIIQGQPVIEMDQKSDSTKPKKTLAHAGKTNLKNITGRLSLAVYSSRVGNQTSISNRYRYTLVFNVKRLFGNNLSAESYISFRHKTNEWAKVKTNLFSALNIYSLAIKYQAGVNDQFWIGRRVNQSVSNLGAMDGLQYEKNVGKMTYGAMLGSRPDYTDYSVNLKLLQAGIFGSHHFTSKSGMNMMNTIALFDQRNTFKTDRRFVYIQHVNNLIKNVNIFSSAEFDLFKLIGGKAFSSFDPSSIYLSLRYKLNKKIILSTSYDALKNIVYYESYKNFIDQLIEKEVRQGLRFGAYYDPWRNISIGTNFGYRFQRNRQDPSKNADIYVSMYQIPFLHMGATFSATYLNTNYLRGIIKGVRCTKNVFKDRLSFETGYRSIRYAYSTEENTLDQRIIEIGMNARLHHKLSLGLNFESTLQGAQNYSTLFCNFIKRF